MEFSFRQFYLKPGKNFNFSYKLQQYVSEQVTKKVFSTANTPTAGEWEIYFWVTSDTMNQDYKLSLDSVGKKNKRKTYVFNFSYKKVKEAKEPLKVFVKFLFDAIGSLNSKEYQIDMVKLEKLEQVVLQKFRQTRQNSMIPNKKY